MSHFYYDFSKTGAFDITNGAETVTINSVKHVVDSCVCKNCKAIVAARNPAPKKEEWTYKYVYTPPVAAPPAPKCCGCCHHH